MLQKTVNKLKEKFGERILDTNLFREKLSIVVRKEAIVDITRFLKEDKELSYNFLSDMCGVDYLVRKPRFDVVYNLYSIKNKIRIMLKVMVDDNDAIPSITPNWQSANWLEREIYDMFGIVFENHPDLRRILMPDDFSRV